MTTKCVVVIFGAHMINYILDLQNVQKRQVHLNEYSLILTNIEKFKPTKVDPLVLEFGIFKVETLSKFSPPSTIN